MYLDEQRPSWDASGSATGTPPNDGCSTDGEGNRTLNAASDVLHQPRNRSRSASTFCERNPPRVRVPHAVACDATRQVRWSYIARDDAMHDAFDCLACPAAVLH
jgi:hypothetical protein